MTKKKRALILLFQKPLRTSARIQRSRNQISVTLSILFVFFSTDALYTFYICTTIPSLAYTTKCIAALVLVPYELETVHRYVPISAAWTSLIVREGFCGVPPIYFPDILVDMKMWYVYEYHFTITTGGYDAEKLHGNVTLLLAFTDCV